MAERSSRIDALDYARLAAAFAVLFYHYVVNGPRGPKIESIATPDVATPFHYGYLGVQFFFLLSGYMVFRSAENRTSGEYLKSRLIRLFPAYLFCMTLTAIVLGVFPSPAMPVSVLQYVANLTMLPEQLGQNYIDGAHWTLAFEIGFYALLFLILRFGQVQHADRLFAIWLILCLLQQISGWRIPGGDANFSLFVGGCLLYEIRRDGWSHLRGALLFGAIAISSVDAYLQASNLNASRGEFLIPGVCAGLIVLFYAFIFLAGQARFSGIRLPAAIFLGAVSYPLYLLHAHLGYRALDAFATPDSQIGVTLAVILGTFALASIVVVFVERPLQRRLRAIGRRDPLPPPVVPESTVSH